MNDLMQRHLEAVNHVAYAHQPDPSAYVLVTAFVMLIFTVSISAIVYKHAKEKGKKEAVDHLVGKMAEDDLKKEMKMRNDLSDDGVADATLVQADEASDEPIDNPSVVSADVAGAVLVSPEPSAQSLGSTVAMTAPDLITPVQPSHQTGDTRSDDLDPIYAGLFGDDDDSSVAFPS